MKLMIRKEVQFTLRDHTAEVWEEVLKAFRVMADKHCLWSKVIGNSIIIEQQKCRLSEESMGEVLTLLEEEHLEHSPYELNVWLDGGQITLEIE